MFSYKDCWLFGNHSEFHRDCAESFRHPHQPENFGHNPSPNRAGIKRNQRHFFQRRIVSDFLGSATVPVALVGVSPASRTLMLPTPLGAGSKDGRVFGETPKTAVGTTALPKATASFRLRASLPGIQFYARTESLNALTASFSRLFGLGG